jgi:hypothetical protein
MALRKNKTKIFNGKRYERAGQSPAKTSKQKRDLANWAEFQRKNNNRNVRIVKEENGYEAYISVAKRK